MFHSQSDKIIYNTKANQFTAAKLCDNFPNLPLTFFFIFNKMFFQLTLLFSRVKQQQKNLPLPIMAWPPLAISQDCGLVITRVLHQCLQGNQSNSLFPVLQSRVQHSEWWDCMMCAAAVSVSSPSNSTAYTISLTQWFTNHFYFRDLPPPEWHILFCW